MLIVSRLTAGYGKLTILHELSLEIQEGQFVAILGPNGSGKSTLLKTIFNLTDVTGGGVEFRNQAVLGRPTEQLAQLGLAYVPQRENVFREMTVRENLLLAVRGASKANARQTMAECLNLFPILEKRQAQKAGKLSGGERQMLAIAMGWLKRPQLMLLDEPSAGLAPLFVAEVFRTLKELCRTGITLAVVEQNARAFCAGVIMPT
ncbi:MAG: ABC transporter ATP-binding protein [Anaerolineales bacterium]|nr:ABC transporter ATP-binding protein [Anaerolineales bacterium]